MVHVGTRDRKWVREGRRKGVPVGQEIGDQKLHSSILSSVSNAEFGTRWRVGDVFQCNSENGMEKEGNLSKRPRRLLECQQAVYAGCALPSGKCVAAL